MRCLIVTAEPDLRDYLQSCVESLAAVEVVRAADGAEALERIRGGGVDLVISDLDQPRMNGLELAQAIAPLRIPMLLLSAELDGSEARAAGASGVMTMPFRRRDLARRVEELMSPAGRLTLAAGACCAYPGSPDAARS